jgi:hypothetical protein
VPAGWLAWSLALDANHSQGNRSLKNRVLWQLKTRSPGTLWPKPTGDPAFSSAKSEASGLTSPAEGRLGPTNRVAL